MRRISEPVECQKKGRPEKRFGPHLVCAQRNCGGGERPVHGARACGKQKGLRGKSHWASSVVVLETKSEKRPNLHRIEEDPEEDVDANKKGKGDAGHHIKG